MRTSVVALAIALFLSGCATEYRAFPVVFTNDTDRELVLDLYVRFDEEWENGRDLNRTVRVPAGENFVENWRLRTSHYNVTIDGAPSGRVYESVYPCAISHVYVVINSTSVAWDVSRGDGWAGC